MSKAPIDYLVPEPVPGKPGAYVLRCPDGSLFNLPQKIAQAELTGKRR